MRVRIASIFVASLSMALPALASGGEEAPSFFWTTVNFGILLALLFFFARKPAQAFFTERREGIRQDLCVKVRTVTAHDDGPVATGQGLREGLSHALTQVSGTLCVIGGIRPQPTGHEFAITAFMMHLELGAVSRREDPGLEQAVFRQTAMQGGGALGAQGGDQARFTFAGFRVACEKYECFHQAALFSLPCLR